MQLLDPGLLSTVSLAMTIVILLWAIRNDYLKKEAELSLLTKPTAHLYPKPRKKRRAET